MNFRVEPPEKKKKKTENSSPPPLSPSFSSLPEEITVNCLARISRPYYPLISVVSKTFHSILSSTELYVARSHLGSTEQCIYVCLWDKNNQFPQWFTLWINPNRTIPNSITKKRKKKKKKKKKTSGQLLVPITSSNFPSLARRSTIVVGSDIYVIGGPIDNEPSSAVRILDCRSHTWRDGPSMIVAREDAAACYYDGKIYVMGGVEDEPWTEVFDIKTQTWKRLALKRKWSIYKIAEIQGKIHFWYYFENPSISYAYDPKQGKWECCNGDHFIFPEPECVMDGVGYMRYFMRLLFYDLQSSGGYWKEVKGLDSLRDKYTRNGGSTDNTTKLVSCGGKLYLIWEGNMSLNPNIMKKIWCAEIAVEKRDGGEVWGNVEWVDVVRSVPSSCELLQFLVVSV